MSKENSAEDDWFHAISKAESAYKELIAEGCAPQIARSVFPNALASRIIVTGNLPKTGVISLLMANDKRIPPSNAAGNHPTACPVQSADSDSVRRH
jgi:hypothetical protein